MSTEPIKAGDVCEIVEGALGTTEPNIGKFVKVVSLQGEHSAHGRIWRVQGTHLVTEFGATGNQLDCAQSWLRKLPPPEQPLSAECKVVSA